MLERKVCHAPVCMLLSLLLSRHMACIPLNLQADFVCARPVWQTHSISGWKTYSGWSTQSYLVLRLTDTEIRLWGCQGGRGRRGIDREFGVGRGKLLHTGWTDNKVLLYSTGKWKKLKSLSRVWLSVTPRTVAHQAPLSVGFSRQECWSGSPFPSPGFQLFIQMFQLAIFVIGNSFTFSSSSILISFVHNAWLYNAFYMHYKCI